MSDTGHGPVTEPLVTPAREPKPKVGVPWQWWAVVAGAVILALVIGFFAYRAVESQITKAKSADNAKISALAAALKQTPGGKKAVKQILGTTKTGPTGPAGPTGPTGPTGEQGPRGFVGAQGEMGTPGPVGATGSRGSQGPRGAAGLVGSPGITGATGERGPAGFSPPPTPGPPGSPGKPGATGPAGPAGAAGAAGPQGPAGVAGQNGTSAFPFTFHYVTPNGNLVNCTITSPTVSVCTDTGGAG